MAADLAVNVEQPALNWKYRHAKYERVVMVKNYSYYYLFGIFHVLQDTISSLDVLDRIARISMPKHFLKGQNSLKIFS